MWEIKGKNNEVKATVNTLEYNGVWMGQSYVSATIESPTPIDFQIGDYIIYRGERFEINYEPGKIKSAPQYEKGDAFKYENIKFNSFADELTRCEFRDFVLLDNQLHFTGLPKFSFYGNVHTLASRIQANLDRVYGKNTWIVTVSMEYDDNKEINVAANNISIQGALEILVNDFKAYYTIKERTITIGAAGIPTGHLFKYGKGNGLYEIEQNAEADQAIVTRLHAYGSTRNLPHRYYNSLTGADGQKFIPDNMAVQHLMLPSFPYTTQDPYIDSPNKAALGIREGSIFFDGSVEGLPEIYPSIEGMTAEDLRKAGEQCDAIGPLDWIVSAEQMTDNGVGEIKEGETDSKANPPTFKVVLKDPGFDIWEHRIAGTAPVMSFKTGMLGGRDFEIVDCKKEGSNYIVELNRAYDDSIKLWFPYASHNAAADDKFVLLHIEMPEVYIKAAALRLFTAAAKWLSKNDYSRSIYAPKIDENFMARQHDEAIASGGTIKSLHDTLKEGMLLLFEDEDLNIDASIFIDHLTIKEEADKIPTYEVVLKEEKVVGRLDKMQNQIDSLAAGFGQGSGGYNAAQIRSIIEAYGAQRFLLKLKDDRTSGLLSSDKGFEVGKYLAGVSGGIFGIDRETNDSFAEVARLYVRTKAFFEELTTQKSSVLAGKQYITPGGGITCAWVEEKGLIERHPAILCENGTPITLENGGMLVAEHSELVDNGVPEDVYRCYFLSEQDGEKVNCRFEVGDMAISEMFNARAGSSNKISNHRYWRLVTGVNNDAFNDENGNHYGYIDLSKTECDRGSDIPQTGDEICQFGNDNKNPGRQSAMSFSTVDLDSPSIKLFSGIGSGATIGERFSLRNRDLISMGYDSVRGRAYFKAYGDAFIGDRGESTFIKYDSETRKLTAKLALEIQSTIGDKTFEEYIKEVAPPLEQEDIEEYVRNIVGPDLNLIQKQIDGVIEVHFANGVPTLTNAPASGWATESEKEKHLGDLYFDNDTGLAYRFSKTDDGSYYWNDKVDSATAKALAAAKDAHDVADGKRRIFTETPTTPYDKGDLWVNATYPSWNTEKDPANEKYCNDILRCNSSRQTGDFNIKDWGLASNYTDDTLAQQALEGVAGLDYLKNALSPENPTQITGGLIMSTLLSLGYKDASGVRHNLAGMNGSWVDALGEKTIAMWFGGEMLDRENLPEGADISKAATSLIRMDGSGYYSKGAFSWDTLGNPKFGSGVKVDWGDGTSSAIGESIASFFNFISNLSEAFVPANANGDLPWTAIGSATYIHAKKAIYSDGDVGAFGMDGDDGGSGSGSGGTSYNRLDAWADYDLSKSGWVLSAGLGADLDARLKTIEDSLGDSAYATKSWVEAQGYLKSDALTGYATMDWIALQGYLTQSSLNGYATQSWVNSQKYLQESSYATILDSRYYTEEEIDDKLGSYIATSGGTITGALSFNRPGSRYGFYIEALDDGSMRVNATLDDQYLKALFTLEYEARQFSLFKAYIGESLALDGQSVIYGSPAISDTQRIYLNHEKTVWVRYNATLNAIECSHSIVSHGDVAAFIE